MATSNIQNTPQVRRCATMDVHRRLLNENPTLYYSSHAVGGVAYNINRCQNSW